MNIQRIQKVKKIAALIIGLVILYISIDFSNRGFGFEVKSAGWIGIALAISITVIELIFNGLLAYQESNITLYILGVTAYFYGVFSNVIGVWSVQGLNVSAWQDVNVNVWFGVFIGLFVEIAAEPLIVYGLVGVSKTEGDMFGALFHVFDRQNNGGNKQQLQQQQPAKPQFTNFAPPKFNHPVAQFKSANDYGKRPVGRPKLNRPTSFKPNDEEDE